MEEPTGPAHQRHVLQVRPGTTLCSRTLIAMACTAHTLAACQDVEERAYGRQGREGVDCLTPLAVASVRRCSAPRLCVPRLSVPWAVRLRVPGCGSMRKQRSASRQRGGAAQRATGSCWESTGQWFDHLTTLVGRGSSAARFFKEGNVHKAYTYFIATKSKCFAHP